jgi:DNA-binding transcriptional regulator YiaG
MDSVITTLISCRLLQRQGSNKQTNMKKLDQTKYPQFAKEAIKRLRTEKRLSQAEFAETLNVAQQQVAAWENGVRVPKIEALLNIMKVFETGFTLRMDGENAGIFFTEN